MKAAILLPLSLLAACGSSYDAPGSVTQGQADQLNDAATMLDANSVDANALAIPGNNVAQPR
jgi:hypothetical protein